MDWKSHCHQVVPYLCPLSPLLLSGAANCPLEKCFCAIRHVVLSYLALTQQNPPDDLTIGECCEVE